MDECSRRVQWPAARATPQHAADIGRPSLVPPSSAIPAAGDKQKYDDDDHKGCVVHIVLLPRRSLDCIWPNAVTSQLGTPLATVARVRRAEASAGQNEMPSA